MKVLVDAVIVRVEGEEDAAAGVLGESLAAPPRREAAERR
jgi:hypothetical protein